MTERMAESRRRKLVARRQAKAICKDLNLYEIKCFLGEMLEASSEVAYAVQDEDVFEDILGEDDAYSFRMAFTVLENDADKFSSDMEECWVPEDFDDVMVGLRAGDRMLYYDEDEGDYFGFEEDWAQEDAIREAQKRLSRHTKSELLEAYGQCVRIAICYIALKTRYENLKDTLDIIRDKNENVLEITRQIDALYEKVMEEFPNYRDEREFQRLLNDLPQECWIR